jgi:hypothetical protein
MLDRDAITLTRGNHTPGEGYCIEELVSTLAGEPWSDVPACVSPVIAAYCRALNDRLPDAPRQRLKAYAARQVGTAGDADAELRRAYLCADYAVRRFAPAVLRTVGLERAAERLEALPPVVDRASAATAVSAAGAAMDAADGVGGAADAVTYTAYDAVGAAAVAVADAAYAAHAAVYAAHAATAAGQWDDAFVLLEALLTA